ncbi:glycosyltransferase [Planctomyces sp. SH-PL14]|uniref:glycosyltransferase n=1 Tax=Planctomyces sp. SH-PL14 TaxID=1632864 RepID=UPI00078BA0B6|nr:glycosyltransferase [Planctomyces sp. SH-PL14]AMV21424.1 N-acetylgalactosamine-N,N'-diacetylbacillosaminyl-diphospho-undecaprenol 4-alpha-N-acetylgalactosaminyltransferase [Planctomyces sp. SH-PL14]
MSRRSVLFVVGSMGGGGAERQIVEILKRLDRSRFRPVLYLAHKRGELLGEVPADIPVYSFWDDFAGTIRSKFHYLLGTTDRARWRQMAEVIRREQIDLVFDQLFLATLDAAQACHRAGRPRISVCQYEPMADVREYARGGSLDQAIAVARDAYSSADRVVAVSNGVRESLIRDIGVPPERIEVHYNLVDLEEAERRSGESDPGFDPGRFHLLTVARLAEQKGHVFLIEAVDRLVHREGRSELLWHIVGTGPLEESLRAEVRRRHLEEHIRFEGFCPNPYPFYRHANLFCLPSKNEGLPCVLLEALACGLPVLSTDCPSGPREVLDGGRAGRLVPPGDPIALAEAIGDCLAHPSAWAEQARIGKGSVERTFAMNPGVRRLETLFDEVAARPRENPRGAGTSP